MIALIRKSVYANSIEDLGYSIEESGLMLSELKEAGVSDSSIASFRTVLFIESE